jgi:hypothetical protein
VYLQVVVWAYAELLCLKPMTNQYVPKRKLCSCSQWLQSWLKYINDSFDNMAIYLAPLIHVKEGASPGMLSGMLSLISEACSSQSNSMQQGCCSGGLLSWHHTIGVLARAHAHDCDNAAPTSTHILDSSLESSHGFDYFKPDPNDSCPHC